MTRSGGKSSAAVAGCNAVPCKVNRRRQQCRTPIPRPTDHRRPPQCVVPRCVRPARARANSIWGPRPGSTIAHIATRAARKNLCRLNVWKGGPGGERTRTPPSRPARSRAHMTLRATKCACACVIRTIYYVVIRVCNACM